MITSEDGETVPVWCSSKILAERLEEKKPRPGDFIVITFFGECESRQGRSYKRFGLEVVRPDGDPDSSKSNTPAVVAANGSSESLGVTNDDVPF